MTKKQRQKLKYLENEEFLRENKKAFFIIFKWFSESINCLRPKSAPLIRVNLPDSICLCENNGFTVFQNVLLSVILFTSRLD